tara:strand:+ start:929 stop:1150 length:222 start_codon:yes stop_codon:yes gene_type:complete
MVIKTMTLLLYLGGGIIEHTGPMSMSECLKMKRTIERHGWKDRKDTRYSCEKKKVEVDVGPDGKEFIVRIVEE